MHKVKVKGAKISNYCDLIHGDEMDLEKALAQQVIPTLSSHTRTHLTNAPRITGHTHVLKAGFVLGGPHLISNIFD